MNGALARIPAELGVLGTVSLALLAAALAFFFWVLAPLEAQGERLDRRLTEKARVGVREANPIRAASPGGKVAAFYQFFEREEATIEWLAKLYAIGKAVGVELRAAEYRLVETRQRLVRYEIVLPLSGSYSQVRAFLENALNEIPIASLDQVNLHRKRANDPQVEAEARLTLHLLER